MVHHHQLKDLLSTSMMFLRTEVILLAIPAIISVEFTHGMSMATRDMELQIPLPTASTFHVIHTTTEYDSASNRILQRIAAILLRTNQRAQVALYYCALNKYFDK